MDGTAKEWMHHNSSLMKEWWHYQDKSHDKACAGWNVFGKNNLSTAEIK